MPRKIKEQMVKELTEKFQGIGQCGCVVLGYKGMKAQESASVRRLISERGARMTVVRNALFGLALKELGRSEIGELLDGPTAIVTGEDIVQAAKAAGDAVKICPALSLVGAYAEGHILDAAGVERLAALPSREVLLSQALSCMCAPAQKFVNCLTGLTVKLAGLFDQLRKKREAEST